VFIFYIRKIQYTPVVALFDVLDPVTGLPTGETEERALVTEEGTPIALSPEEEGT
jgi:hypothetical protein